MSPTPQSFRAPHTQPPPARHILALLALWLIIFFAALFSPPLLDDADSTHAQAARAMVVTGDWVTLHVDGVRYLEKPPLPYWLVALSFRLFGFNTFAVHLPLALAVLALTMLGYLWARQVFDCRTALYTGFATLTCTGVFLFTRIFIPEVLLSLLLCIALYAFHRTLESTTESPTTNLAAPFMSQSHRDMGGVGGPYVLWTALALAVLTKGFVALVFFFATAILYLALTGNLRHWRRLRPFSGIALFLLIAAPWHILASLRNTGGENGHGFFWFYFINEHVLRFLGRRLPRDYNKLPFALYWSLHLVWLFPWSLFAPIAAVLAWRNRPTLRSKGNGLQREGNGLQPNTFPPQHLVISTEGGALSSRVNLSSRPESSRTLRRRSGEIAAFLSARRTNLKSHTLKPWRKTPDALAARTILLLCLYSAIVLIFFSLSTNQEYYTFPAYLPLLLLICAALVRAEHAFVTDRTLRRSILAAHIAYTVIGVGAAAALAYGLWSARGLPFVPDIGDLLAHRGVGDYTLSMSHFFDLTGPSFAALRLPATLAMLAFAVGPAAAWVLRRRRKHLAATLAVALTSALFLIAAHIALNRFAPMLSSKSVAEKIEELADDKLIERDNSVLIFGDQSFGSSIPFYLDEAVELVDGRSTSMEFGSTFPDAPPIFLTPQDLLNQWGHGRRKLLFVPAERRLDVDRLLGQNKIVLEETSGKALLTDRPLDTPTPSGLR